MSPEHNMLGLDPLRDTQVVQPLEYQRMQNERAFTASYQPMPIDQIEIDPKDRTMRQRRHQMRNASGDILGGRVKRCGRTPTGPRVDIWRSSNGAHFRGVVTCGSVWACPVCAAKITETRRGEVAHAIERCYAEGGAAYMVTLTRQHAAFDACGELRDSVAGAWRSLTGNRPFNRAKKQFGIFGYCRAMEVTHGHHGWHPHLHVLLFTEKPLDELEQEELRLALFEAWDRRITKDTGRPCSPNACDLRPATVSDYLTKWAADRELTKHDAKSGRNGSRSPWAILDDYERHGHWRDRKLFREYGKAFKGARHLTWSRGLKDRMGVHELADEEAAAYQDETVQEEIPLEDGLIEGCIGSLDRATWQAICHKGLTAVVLDAAHTRGWVGVVSILKKHGLWALYEPEAPPRQPPRTPQGPKQVRLQSWEWAHMTGGRYFGQGRYRDDTDRGPCPPVDPVPGGAPGHA